MLYEVITHPRDVRTVGRYALQFTWSDGHNTGLYTFDSPCAMRTWISIPATGAPGSLWSPSYNFV